ncbi:MAG TPA: hypothetical protein VFN74_02945 [Chloroflexota bacterium]|nr:hypothetical protein [Chloroflexota bacterium]
MNLAEHRAALRLDLNDPAGAAQRFADADLTRAITRAVSELTLAHPRLTDTEVVLASATRTIPLPALTFPNLIDVEEIEHPYGAAGIASTVPPTLPPFLLAPDRASALLLTADVPAAGSRLRLRWTGPHQIAEATTTVPAELDYMLSRGAYGFACLAYSTPAADNFRYEDGATVATVDDSMIPTAWRIRANEALAEFRESLTLLRLRRTLSVTTTWPLEAA